MLTKVGHGILKHRLFVACPCALKQNNNKVTILSEEDFIKQPFLNVYAKLKGNTNVITKNNMLTQVGHGILNKRLFVACPCTLTENNKVKIILEEEFIEQPILNLYAKFRGNTSGIKNHMLTKVGHDILKRRCVVACRCALEKKK